MVTNPPFQSVSLAHTTITRECMGLNRCGGGFKSSLKGQTDTDLWPFLM